MMIRLNLIPLFVFCLGLCFMEAFADDSVPEGGVSLLSADVLSQPVKFYGGEGLATQETVDLVDEPFAKALQVELLKGGGQFFNTAAMFPANSAVQKEDCVLVKVSMRSLENRDESGVSRCTVFVQGPPPGYKKYLIREIEAGTDWQSYTFSFPVTDDLAAGDLSLQFGFGGGLHPHRFELAGIQFLNYRDLYLLEDLPTTLSTYDGREADAPWRKSAADRIEIYRKGDFRVKVLDENQQALEGVMLKISLQKHAFHFGSVVKVGLLTADGESNARYREAFLEMFNQSGTENGLKWEPWESNWGAYYSQENTLSALKWLKDHEIYTRGHVMVWPGKKYLPSRITDLVPEDDPTKANPLVKQMVLDHIAEMGRATLELTDEWDVVNEPYNNHVLMDAFGDEIMVDWFKAAREVLPEQGLYLNDFGILSAGGQDEAHQQHFEDTLAFLVENGAPITGMGMQGHFGEMPTSISKMYEILQRYHQKFPALDIRITEFDVNTRDEDLQADYTRDLLTLAFSHPAVVGVQCWGFWAGAHWRAEAAMFTQNWEMKPNGVAWKKLTQETWWTELEGESDAEGVFAGRGFYGSYEVEVSYQGKVMVHDFELEQGGDEVQVIELILAD